MGDPRVHRHHSSRREGRLKSLYATRLPVQEIGDEFDCVARNVNRLLDQIERLTSGMRTVIDSGRTICAAR